MTGLFNATSAALDDIRDRARRQAYKEDPVLWAKDVPGIHLWSQQADVARSVAKNKDVVVKAGHGVGKSLLAALLVCWWIDTRYPDCFVASTAPSTAQIGAIVWREIENISAMVDRRFKEGKVDHRLPGYRTSQNEWKTESGTVIGFGRKPPDGENRTGDSLQGIHASGGVLAIGDEAVGLTQSLIDALGNITSTRNSRRLLICNPTNPGSYVAKLFKDQPANWTYHTISVLKSPNFTEEKHVTPPEVLEALTDESYLESKREEYGEGSPMWKSRVEGEFAWDMGNTLFKQADLERGYDVIAPISDDALPVLGVDVSRSKAGDTNTIYEFLNGRLRFVSEWNDANAMNTAAKINDTALSRGVSEVRIDGAGLGGPIADRVRELSEGRYDVIEILGGNASPDRNRWFNFRAWSFWSLQDRLSKGLIDLDIADEQLADELLGMEIKKRTSGVANLLMESKEDMRARNVKSPNRADAANYASIDLRSLINPHEGELVAQERAEVPDYGLMDHISSAGWAMA